MNRSRNGRVLVTGGSGFLGINLIRHLLRHGFEVVSYDLAPFDYPERHLIQEVTGDIREMSRLASAMKGCDLVVHAAAALPLYSDHDIRTTEVDGTRNVLEAALATGIKRVIYISSTAVYGVPDRHPLFESDPVIGVGAYGRAKVEAERLATEYRSQELVVSVIRPKSFVGPERLGVFALLYDWAKDGHNFPILGDGNNRYQLLDVADLAEAIRLCLTLPAGQVNDVFNIGAKQFGTIRQDYQAVLDRAGYSKAIIGLPARPAIAILKILEALHISPLYRWVYETAAKDSFVSIEKAEKQLGYAPTYSNQDALIRNYEWYVSNYTTFARQTGVSHRVPWKQGILAIAKRFF